MSDRAELLLAMILLNQMHASSQATKAEVLNRAGFSNGEIAAFLGTTSGVVAQQLYALRGSKRGARGDVKRAARKKSARKRTPKK